MSWLWTTTLKEYLSGEIYCIQLDHAGNVFRFTTNPPYITNGITISGAACMARFWCLIATPAAIPIKNPDSPKKLKAV